ncbi:ATP-binding protein [Candidatus Sumerlaeota bacterium]
MTEGKHHTRIGAFVLETLTTGMYRNPLDALREYVQNAFDSIRAAERQDVIKAHAGRINISISTENRMLCLRDNGIGVAASDVAARLVNIGMSGKNLESDAGFRGIGRLAGIAYCDSLVFKTQHHEEKKVSTVTFDARALREAMSPKNREVKELGEVVDTYVAVTTEPARKKDHFLEVSMNGINSNGDAFLAPKDVRLYLEQVAPLPMDTQSFHLAREFYDWVKKAGVALPEVNVVIDSDGTSYELFKPYKKLTYSTAQGNHKVHVRGLHFFPQNITSDSPFWLWYAETNCPGVIRDDAVAGLRLRKSNIGIGLSERMTDVFRMASESYARFNRYFIGEVHVQDSSVIPNAHRDDFEESPEWIDIRDQLVLFAKERSREAYSHSEGRNADVEKLVTNADRQLEEAAKKQHTGLASRTEQDKLSTSIEKHITKMTAAEKADRSEEERRRLDKKRKELQKAKERIANETKFIGQTLKSSLDKKQRKIISDILGLLYDVLDGQNFETAKAAILKKYQAPEKD